MDYTFLPWCTYTDPELASIGLNELIDRSPEEYRSRSGELCRYPEHESRTYPLGETEADCELAKQISGIADSLLGIAYLQSRIEMPAALAKEGWDEAKYLEARLLSAKRLARYVIMSCLRSSRAALVEHVEGTEAALKFENLSESAKKNPTGDQMNKLSELSGRPPGHALSVDAPDWLTDITAHAASCREEIGRYKEISRLVRSMSIFQSRLIPSQFRWLS